MRGSVAPESGQQFSLAYVLAEIALIAIALASGRLALSHSGVWIEAQAALSCLAFIAGCGALGGLCLRMAMGLIAGGVFAVASIPLLWLVISSAA
jgi:hypothetical protein